MSEMIKNMAMLVWVACAMNAPKVAQAQGVQEEDAPTLVYGSSETAQGVVDETIVEQPADAANPLGDPIPNVLTAPTTQQPQTMPVAATKPAEEPVSPAIPESGQPLGNDFQNTLEEANGMVYDVQAYPEADLKAIGNPSNPETLYSPNVNP